MLRAIYFCWLLSAAAAVLTTVPAHGQGIIPTGIPTVPSLRETQFPTTQRAILNTLGDRLKKPGKESLIMVGTLDQFTGAKKTSSDAVTAVWQYPGLMRMTYANGNKTFTSNGGSAVLTVGAVAQEDVDFAESFVKDSAESFLLAGFSGSRVQLIGHQYNINDPRTTNRLPGGLCDLLSVSEINGVGGPGSKTDKTFCFDSKTSLLKAIVYHVGGNLVETRYSGWRVVSGENVPGVIERFNNNARSFTLTASSSDRFRCAAGRVLQRSIGEDTMHRKLVLYAVALSIAVFGQTLPNPQDVQTLRGIVPTSSYSVSDLDTINTVNGNVLFHLLIVSLPPGPAGGQLKDSDEIEKEFIGSCT